MGRDMKPGTVESETSSRYWAYVVGANTRRIRMARGLTMNDLADLLLQRGWSVHPTTLSLMERNKLTGVSTASGRAEGHIQVTVDRMVMIANALGVHYLELMREDAL